MVALPAKFLTCLGGGQVDSTSARREYRVQFRVETTSQFDGPRIASMAPGLPKPGDIYKFGNEFDFGAFAKALDAQLENWEQHLRRWIVTVTYSNDGGENSEDQKTDNPLNEPPKIRGGGRRFSEVVYKDNFGKPIETTCGEPLLLERERVDLELTIEQNVASIDMGDWALYSYCVSSDTYLGLPPRSWLMEPWDWEKLYAGKKAYYRRVVKLMARYNKWDDEVLNAGLYEFTSDKKGVKRIKDLLGNDVSSPVRLTQDGFQQPKNAPPVYLKFRTIRELAFSTLGLPVSI